MAVSPPPPPEHSCFGVRGGQIADLVIREQQCLDKGNSSAFSKETAMPVTLRYQQLQHAAVDGPLRAGAYVTMIENAVESTM